jgi:hypothetical protein
MKKNLVNFILGFVILLLIAVIICSFITKQAHANVVAPTHNVWSGWTRWSDWSECTPKHEEKFLQVSDGQECGDSVEGTQTRTTTRTCQSQNGVGLNECSPLGKVQTDTQTRDCKIENPCPTLSPTPTATPSPTITPEPTQAPSECTSNCLPVFAGSSTDAPVCTEGTTVLLPANPFVVRKGSEATVNFFLTQGDRANIYYKVVGQSNWQFSVPDLTPNGDKFISYTIQGLNPQLGYDFGIQQVQGCGGGQMVTAVIVDGPQAKTFRFSYWIWAN